MRCRSCLKECENDFCRTCSRKIFNKNKFSAKLDFTLPDIAQGTGDGVKRISISGAQIKFLLRFNWKKLEPTDRAGTYILKPATSMRFRLFRDMPANEHVTMQMAKQIFKMNVAESALMEFSSGEFAYLTKRFDVRKDDTRIHQEDFAQVADVCSQNAGSNFKYGSFSYEEIAGLIKQHVSAYIVAAEEFFRIILFNYLVCNGDAHIKNFSIYSPNKEGVFVLTPAYDLLNTSLHTSDERMALDLFADEENYESEFFSANGFYGAPDFMEFAKRIGIVEKRAGRFIREITSHLDEMNEMIDASFLSEEAKVKYKECIHDRARALKIL